MSCADMLKPRIIRNQPLRVEGQQNNTAESYENRPQDVPGSAGRGLTHANGSGFQGMNMLNKD